MFLSYLRGSVINLTAFLFELLSKGLDYLFDFAVDLLMIG